MEETSSETESEIELEAIIDQLIESERMLPIEAFEAARRHRHEITPLLIRLIEDATRDCRQDLIVQDSGHFFATYLLAEFGATEAWPAFLEAISLPGEKPFELYEDAITEDFGHIIASLVGDRCDAIDEMIDNASINLYVRWKAVEALLFQVRDGLTTREEAIQRLGHHLQRAIDNQDEVAEGLVLRLEDLGAESELPLIEKAFADGLIDPQMVTLDWVKEHIAKGDEIFEETMERLRRPDDIVSHLSSWAAFQDEEGIDDELDDSFLDDSPISYSADYGYEGEYLSGNETTVRNEAVKIGRNEKCPCGSGKKYKKCCGRTSALGFE